jgi:hypothetical protein
MEKKEKEKEREKKEKKGGEPKKTTGSDGG